MSDVDLNLKQIYDQNPSTTIGNNFLFYMVEDPYDVGDDTAIKFSDVFNQLADSFVQTTGSVTTGHLPVYGASGQLLKDCGIAVDTSQNMSGVGSLSIGGALNMNSHLINNVTDPVSNQDAVTLNFLNNRVMFPNGIVNVSGTTQTITPGTIYFANNASRVTFTLPTSFTTAQNQSFAIIGRGAGGWKIQCATGTQMTIGSRSCTASTGYFQSNQQNDAIIFYPGAANTLYQAISVIGNISNDSSQIANALDCAFTANQLLYSSSTGNLSGLATAVSAQLITNSSGVPAWTASMSDAQIIFGNTSGTPAPGSLIAGTGIGLNYSGGNLTISTNSAATNINPNIIIGGNFDTNPWQTGVSFAAAANDSITADNFKWFQTGSGVITVAQVADAPSFAQAGVVLTNSLGITVTTADSSIAATDIYHLTYAVEGIDWAQVYKQAMTISFDIKATVTGISCFTIFNAANTRCFTAEFTIAQSNTWQQVIINIPADSTGTWSLTPGTVGAYLNWALAVGSNSQTSAGWQTVVTGGYGTSNQVNHMATNGNIYRVDRIYLQPGTWTSVVYPFELYTDVLSRSQRYFETSTDFASGNYFPTTNTNGQVQFNTPQAAGTAGFDVPVFFKVTKAIAPVITMCDTLAATGKAYKGATGQTAATSGIGMTGFQGGSNSAQSANGLTFHYTANSMLF